MLKLKKLIITRSPKFILSILVLVPLISSCSPPLRIKEELVKAHPEGTLMIGEVISPLTRSEILMRYRPVDLEKAGWKELDVVDGTAVVLVNFSQTQGHFNSAHGFYALLDHELKGSLHSDKVNGRFFGGDVVSVRVVEQPSNDSGPSGLNVVESVVDPLSNRMTYSADCAYEDRGELRAKNYRHALYCKSLLAEGWSWYGDEFVKRPANQ